MTAPYGYSESRPYYQPTEAGSRWVHVWIEPIPGSDLSSLWLAWETVGVRLIEIPSLLMPPSDAVSLIETLGTLPLARHGRTSVSVPLMEAKCGSTSTAKS